MDYIKTTLKEAITVKKIVTVHYFEYAKDYIFDGEKHDFWEFLFVDKGEVEVMAESSGYRLAHGDIIFHKPNEFHNVWANGRIAPNLIVVAFESKSPFMNFFEGKIMKIGEEEKHLLAQIVREAKKAYASPLNDPMLKKLAKAENSEFGCEQIIKTSLEQFLITLYRRGESANQGLKLSNSVKERSDNDMMTKIKGFLQENISKNPSFTDICHFCSLSQSNLKTLFREKTGTGVMEYFKNMKIDEAKRMIREGTGNFTEIADLLGYASIHYFSRSFKKATGMSPSEYAASVKVRI